MENITNLVPRKKETFMIHLQIEGLTKSFGDRVLFSDISFGLSEGERVGAHCQERYRKDDPSQYNCRRRELRCRNDNFPQ